MKACRLLIREWLNILFYRKKPKEIASTKLGNGLKELAIASAIFGFLIFALSSLGMSDWVMLVYDLIFYPIIAIIGVLFGGGLLHIFSKLMGGKGSYSNYVGVLAKIQAAILGTAGIAILILTIIALHAIKLIAVGTADLSVFLLLVLAVVLLLIGIWWAILAALATMAVQKLSKIRASIAVIIAHLIIAIILAIPALLLVIFMLIGLSEFISA